MNPATKFACNVLWGSTAACCWAGFLFLSVACAQAIILEDALRDQG